MLRINRANLIRSTSSVRLLWNDARLFNENKTTETRASEEADTDVLIRTVDINESPRASGSDSFLENYKSTPRYKSKYDLANIYPNSTLDFTREVKPPKGEENKFNGHIPIEQLHFSFARSSGPGGQNVNKVNSKVTVQVDLNKAGWISEPTKEKLKEIHKNSLSKEGFWIVRSDKTRSQHLNIADCMDKIRCYITEAERPPKQVSIETLEKIKEGVEKANAARLRKKRHKQALKNMMSSDF